MRDRAFDEAELRELMADGGEAGRRDLSALADLLGSASAGRARTPLPGEEAAVAAFRAAHTAEAGATAPPSRTGRFSRRSTALGAAVAVLLGGGVAVAAATGRLPLPGGPGGGEPAPAVSSPQAPGGATAGPGGPSAGTSTSGTPTAPTAPGESPAAGVPSAPAHEEPPPADPTGRRDDDGRRGQQGAPASGAEPAGLCRSWAHKPPEKRQKALESPAYAPLVDAAGGPGRVTGYCDALGVTAAGTERPGAGRPSADAGRPTAQTPPAHPAKPSQAAEPADPAAPAS